MSETNHRYALREVEWREPAAADIEEPHEAAYTRLVSGR